MSCLLNAYALVIVTDPLVGVLVVLAVWAELSMAKLEVPLSAGSSSTPELKQGLKYLDRHPKHPRNLRLSSPGVLGPLLSYH